MSMTRIFSPRFAARHLEASAGDRIRPRRWGWMLVAAVVVASGCLASLVWAQEIARNDDAGVRQSFETSALEISSALQTAIEHEKDLVVVAGAFVAANPDVTSGELDDWLSSVRAQERYPELLGVGSMSVVAHADLEDFIARLQKDPAVPSGPDGEVAITPAGDRPFYCLSQTLVALKAFPSPFWFDYCAGELGPLILAARDSGQSSIVAIPDAGGTLLVVQTPLYRDGQVPNTVTARQAAYLGSLGVSIAPDVLLAAASLHDPNLTITLTHEGVPSASFSNGDVPDDAESLRDDLGDGWNATITRATPERGLAASDSAIGLLAAGLSASVMLGLLIYALGTGRQRALSLVSRRTGELRHQALHDALTGLPNRTLILDRLEQLLARCGRSGTTGAALYIDLDSFKNVNDTLGHDAGDQLLRAVAARLTTGLRNVDTIGRMGGDEFVVLVEGGSMENAPQLVAERLRDLMRQPFDLDLSPRPIVITTSVGIAAITNGTAANLLRDADIALYCAKTLGRDCYETFRPEMEVDLQNQYALDSELRSASEGEQFRLFYQPIYDLSDLTIVGVEALIRWEHPSRGMLQPDEFIPALEASGQIIEVGRWVVIEACRQAKVWLDRGHDLTMSVNVSARQLDRDSIIDHVAEALALSTLDPAHLSIEITETTLMKDTDLTAVRVSARKALGVQLAIDDFGTGYSSLAYLQRFPVDCLKIDRAFINTIARSAESDALIHTLVQLGKDLGLRTVAEGVETINQLDQLRKVAVDQAQGFLLCRPLSAEALDAKLLWPSRDESPWQVTDPQR